MSPQDKIVGGRRVKGRCGNPKCGSKSPFKYAPPGRFYHFVKNITWGHTCEQHVGPFLSSACVSLGLFSDSRTQGGGKLNIIAGERMTMITTKEDFDEGMNKL
jgi:hypothetical protein